MATLPPPQLVRATSKPSPPTTTSRFTVCGRNLERPRRVKPIIPRLAPNSEAYNGTFVPGMEGSKFAFDGALVVIVRTLVADEPAGTNEGGLKLHWAEAGKPEHEKLTAWLNPFAGVTVNV